MTAEEQVVWDYVLEESSELVLETIRRIEEDGFDRSHPNPETGAEIVALKILSHAYVKTLALLCEKMNHPGVAVAYMQVLPLHVELVKFYTLKELQNKART